MARVNIRGHSLVFPQRIFAPFCTLKLTSQLHFPFSILAISSLTFAVDPEK